MANVPEPLGEDPHDHSARLAAFYTALEVPEGISAIWWTKQVRENDKLAWEVNERKLSVTWDQEFNYWTVADKDMTVIVDEDDTCQNWNEAVGTAIERLNKQSGS